MSSEDRHEELLLRRLERDAEATGLDMKLAYDASLDTFETERRVHVYINGSESGYFGVSVATDDARFGSALIEDLQDFVAQEVGLWPLCPHGTARMSARLNPDQLSWYCGHTSFGTPVGFLQLRN